MLSGGFLPLPEPGDGFLHRRPLGIAPGQTAIKLPDGCPFLEVFAGHVIKAGRPLRDVRRQRRDVFRGIHGQ